ncbi:MAG: hypothetical protein U9O97_05485 [Elusimicrobiota bacterium]|nr:hypothetical protein [Elusimicrobiota bacterium]
MRKLFIIVAKFMGLWIIYSVLFLFLHTGLYLDMLVGMPKNATSIYWSLAGMGVNAIGLVILAWLLLLKTEWLADKFKIKEGDNLPAFNADSALRIGIKLIGIHLAVFALSKISYYRFNFAFVSSCLVFFPSFSNWLLPRC